VASLLAALGLLVLKGLTACAPRLRRLAAVWPAKP
jgi:hypothetical protein